MSWCLKQTKKIETQKNTGGGKKRILVCVGWGGREGGVKRGGKSIDIYFGLGRGGGNYKKFQEEKT